MGILTPAPLRSFATMNQNEARNQINHMKQFILHEATEQKKEIENKAEEEYHLEKQRIVGRERSKLTDQFEKMKDLTKVKAKIEDSKINNIQKLRILEEKNAIIATVFQAAGQALQGAGNDDNTIQGLIRQVRQRQNYPRTPRSTTIKRGGYA